MGGHIYLLFIYIFKKTFLYLIGNTYFFALCPKDNVGQADFNLSNIVFKSYCPPKNIRKAVFQIHDILVWMRIRIADPCL
jgi:hypothetical protein